MTSPSNIWVPQFSDSGLFGTRAEPILQSQYGTEDYPYIRNMSKYDCDLQKGFFNALSPESRFSRFLVPMSGISQSRIRALSAVDHSCHVGLVATVPSEGQTIMVGEARIVRDRPTETTAEFAITLADRWQGFGLAQALLKRMEEKVVHIGVRQMVASTLNSNIAMKKLALRAGYCLSIHPGEARLTRLSKSLSAQSLLH